MTIERNLGNAERVVRLVLGTLFAAWAFSRPDMNGVEWFVVMVSLFLFLNGIFSRCYLWYVLEIDTRGTNSATQTTACLPDSAS